MGYSIITNEIYYDCDKKSIMTAPILINADTVSYDVVEHEIALISGQENYAIPNVAQKDYGKILLTLYADKCIMLENFYCVQECYNDGSEVFDYNGGDHDHSTIYRAIDSLIDNNAITPLSSALDSPATEKDQSRFTGKIIPLSKF